MIYIVNLLNVVAATTITKINLNGNINSSISISISICIAIKLNNLFIAIKSSNNRKRHLGHHVRRQEHHKGGGGLTPSNSGIYIDGVYFICIFMELYMHGDV